MVLRWRYVYGVIKEQLCYQRMLHVQYISFDDSLIFTTSKKQHIRPLGNMAHHHVGANCRFAAERLHD